MPDRFKRDHKKMVQAVLNFGHDLSSDMFPPIRKPDHRESSTFHYEQYEGKESQHIIYTSGKHSPVNHTTSFTSYSSTEPRKKALARVAHETTSLLPGILETAPHAPPKGYLTVDPPVLRSKYCPRLHRTEIRVINGDSLDTAIGLAECSKYITVQDKRPVCVLNMANAHSAGGGWKRGALAQEETLCYRSSLSFTLKLRYYPLPELAAIYSPTVLVFRKSLSDGHELMPLNEPENFPVVSVISVAALCMPDVVMSSDGTKTRRQKYKRASDREIMKEKMRLTLRTAAVNGHRRLVLGALGCGAFLNPREEVADCWAEVFEESEFRGGWWESIIFAVMDDLGQGKSGDGNYGVFYRRLDGKMV